MPASEFDRALGRWMGRERESRGISQEQVATQLGMGQPTVSKIESGHRRILAEELLRWSIALDVDQDLLNEQIAALRRVLGGEYPLGPSERA